MAISYEVGESMALYLKYGTADQGVVLGLKSMTMPGLTRSIITVEEFRNAFARQFAGGGSRGVLGYSGNAVLQDITGQDQLRAYLKANTKFTDARAYFNLDDFLMCDIANDTVSGMQVTKCDFGSADKNGVIPYDGEIVMNGDYAIFTEHYIGAGYTLTASGTVGGTGIGLEATGITVGDALILEGCTTSGDDGMYIVSVVTDDLLTVTDSAGDAVAFAVEALPATGVCHVGRQ